MSDDIKDCLKLKLNWEICSANLVLQDYEDLNVYKNEMNICFDFYKKYKECYLKKK